MSMSLHGQTAGHKVHQKLLVVDSPCDLVFIGGCSLECKSRLVGASIVVCAIVVNGSGFCNFGGCLLRYFHKNH